MNTFAEIEEDIKAIEQNAAIFEERNFAGRADAIDFLNFHVTDRIEGLLHQSQPAEPFDVLMTRAEKLKCRLEEIDKDLFSRCREKIKSRDCAGPKFLDMIAENVYPMDGATNARNQIGYDNLDFFINGLLYNGDVPETTLLLAPEMVFYQKTPARIVFELTRLAQLTPGDVFFDIGSGLGQAVLLVHLISDTTAKGVEYEPAYFEYANTHAALLSLGNVAFINADARDADYSGGTVFFMYTPFEGKMLEDMLNVLEKEAQKRTIKIFTYGPCSPIVARQSWLNCINGPAVDFYTLYGFISTTSPSKG
jgi:SAM-dependent methyltransferase